MDPQLAVISLSALLVAATFHEYAHAWVAYRMGDPTAKEMGRLTLNPIPHIDPVGTIALPGIFMLLDFPILFGWAKPVPINPYRFRNLRVGTFLVSIAGIAMNLWLALFFALLYRVIMKGYLNFLSDTVLVPIGLFSMYSVLINIVFAVFNAIPIPPLDGSRAVMSFFSVRYWELFYRFEIVGFFIITSLLFTGILGKVMFPLIKFLWNYLLGRI